VNMDIFYVMRLQVLLTFVLFVTASASCPAQSRQLRYIAGYPNYNLIPNQTNNDWNVVYLSRNYFNLRDWVKGKLVALTFLFSMSLKTMYWNVKIVSSGIFARTVGHT